MTYRTLARRRWPRAVWIAGRGPYATVASCAGTTSVELHATEAAARATLDFINTYAGGHACRRQHAVVDLRAEAAA